MSRVAVELVQRVANVGDVRRNAQPMDELAEAVEIAADVSRATDSIVRPARLLGAGVSRGTVARLIEIRHLRRIFHGLYLVGGSRLTQRQLHRVAEMRAGPAGCLTAVTSLELRNILWERSGVSMALTPRSRAVGTHHTLLPMESGEPGRIILSRLDDAVSREEVDGLTTAPVARALTDLATFGAGGLLNIAWNQAEYRGLLNEHLLKAETRGTYRGGAPEVAALLARRRILTDPSTDIRGKTELPWLHLMVAAGIPMPMLNAPVFADGQQFFADYLWIKYGLALELDSPDHLTPVRAAADRARDDSFDSVGIHVLRLIDTLALADPEPHLDRVKAALMRRGWPGTPR